MFRRGSIARRIACGYLTVVLLTGLLMGASFYFLLSRHLERAARENLQRDIQNVAGLVGELTPEEQNRHGMMMRQIISYHMLGRVIQGEYLLLSPRGVVLDSSTDRIPVGSVLDPGVLRAIPARGVYQGRVTLGNERYVAAARYLGENAGRGGGVILLLTRVEGLEEIRNELLFIFLVSLGLASLAALLLAMLLARRISQPLTLLKEKAHRVAERNFGWQVDFDTGDEIGELGRAVNAMDEKLAEYDRAQRQFFQNASHELKSPLMSIQGYAEGVRDGVFKGEEATRALDVVVRETGRLKNMVDELVYLGKLESESGSYRYGETDLQEVLEQAVASQRVLAVERGVVLQLGDVPDITLRADGEKLVRVFINIIGNAVRYAASRVEIDTALGDCGTVRVTVRDDGEGFTAEDLQRMWERFYKGPRGGSGLGLPIARAIVEEHGGSITARNANSGGAEIEVVLPL